MDKELEGLAEPVRDAIQRIAGSPMWIEADCVEAELLRLARTNIALTAERDHARLLQRRAESELAALRKRMDDAPVIEAWSGVPYCALAGKRVRLVEESV